LEHLHKSSIISGGQIQLGADMARYEKTARFWLEPGPDMVSGATIFITCGRMYFLFREQF